MPGQGDHYLGFPDNWERGLWYERQADGGYTVSPTQDPRGDGSIGIFARWDGEEGGHDHWSIAGRGSDTADTVGTSAIPPGIGSNYYSINTYQNADGSSYTVEHFPAGVVLEVPNGAILEGSDDGGVLVRFPGTTGIGSSGGGGGDDDGNGNGNGNGGDDDGNGNGGDDGGDGNGGGGDGEEESGCFAAETKVLLATGATRTIETLAVGDAIFCPDIEGESIVILEIREIPNQTTIVLELENGELLETTGRHSFYVEGGRGLVASGELEVGHQLRTRRSPQRVVNVSPGGTRTVYQLVVAEPVNMAISNSHIILPIFKN